MESDSLMGRNPQDLFDEVGGELTEQVNEIVALRKSPALVPGIASAGRSMQTSSQTNHIENDRAGLHGSLAQSLPGGRRSLTNGKSAPKVMRFLQHRCVLPERARQLQPYRNATGAPGRALGV